MKPLVHLGNKIVAQPGSIVEVAIDGRAKLEQIAKDLQQLQELLDSDRLPEGREFLKGIIDECSTSVG